MECVFNRLLFGVLSLLWILCGGHGFAEGNEIRNEIRATEVPVESMNKERLSAVDFSSAQGVMKRIGLADKLPIEWETCPSEEGKDCFETEVKGGVLHVRASSPTAACRAIYDYVKRHGYGFVSWAGTEWRIPDKLDDEPKRRIVSPVVLRTHFNICDFGYSMPYWGWERWEKELDWMALRGINMPLALLGTEAVANRVWRKMGLNDEEIASFYTGPAHMPWHRMGNIAQMGGPVPAEWFDKQIELQQKILGRMRELGMRPICSAFSGFVPRGIKRVHPEVKASLAGWVNRPEWARPLLLSPDDPLFFKIAKAFGEEWENEFGRGEFYLADMFNEQELPIDRKDPGYLDYMARCGEIGYKAATIANPDATWVMQGWILNYQRGIWYEESVRAFMSRIPEDKYIFIDLGTDWNTLVWQNGLSFDVYKGFFGKKWMYSVVPNMGGRTIHTGVLDYYAKGHVKALRSEYADKLVGFGNATEAIECQEMLQEMFFDATWSTEEIDVSKWLENYALCRYGAYPDEMKDAFEGLRKTAYGRYGGSINWSWQDFGMGKGFVNTDDGYLQALESFLKAGEKLEHINSLYAADALEWSAMYLGAKMQYLSAGMIDAIQQADKDEAEAYFKTFSDVGRRADTLLNRHPYMNLRTWIGHARAFGSAEDIRNYYENDARVLIGTWGTKGTVLDDYAGKFWGGMMESFYIPRWRLYLDTQWVDKEEGVNRRDLDFAWTETYGAGVSPQYQESTQDGTPDENVQNAPSADSHAQSYALARTYLEDAKSIKAPQPPTTPNTPVLGHWNPQAVSEEWKTIEWSIPQDILPRIKGVRFAFKKGSHRLEIRHVMLESDGKIIAEDRHNAEASNAPKKNVFRFKLPSDVGGNNSRSLRAEVRTDGGTDSFGDLELILEKESL